jgi:hypothetical protein
MVNCREIENISRGPTFGDFVTIRTEASMQPFKCNVLRESLSVGSNSIPCATLKKEKEVVGNVCVSQVN